tara:strand:- start:539 stop:649 length:111 start_codon:yes stop_codon:yes gene_type:complete
MDQLGIEDDDPIINGIEQKKYIFGDLSPSKVMMLGL